MIVNLYNILQKLRDLSTYLSVSFVIESDKSKTPGSSSTSLSWHVDISYITKLFEKWLQILQFRDVLSY